MEEEAKPTQASCFLIPIFSHILVIKIPIYNLKPFLYLDDREPVDVLQTGRKLPFVLRRLDCHMITIDLIHVKWRMYCYTLSR